MMTSVGERIKMRREELAIKQGQLAKRVGFSQATLSELESDPRAKTREVAKIAAVLGVNALWLAEGKGPKMPDGTAPVIEYATPPIEPKSSVFLSDWQCYRTKNYGHCLSCLVLSYKGKSG
jgi:transcriptional regulator with XRE-family HTH domain